MIPVRKIAIKKARKDLKWSPKTTLYEGLKKTISWYKKLMIITKTPYRISFFGGGTDFPIWYKKNKSQVISTTINKYSYIVLEIFLQFLITNLELGIILEKK